MNTFGKHFRITTFGESHGPAYGVIVDGCPSNVSFHLPTLKSHLEKRKPGRFPWQTSRTEPDEPQVLSGVFQGKTLGTPIGIIVMNQDARSQDYEEIKKNPRAGHADDLWKYKFKNYDHRGGGRASGRETIGRVMGGAVALMFLKELNKNFQTFSVTTQIGPIQLEQNEWNLQDFLNHPKNLDQYIASFPHKEKSKQVKDLLMKAKEDGQSYGGTVCVYIQNIPKGLGQPIFNKLKSDLSHGLVGVGSVCGVSFGIQKGDLQKSGQVFHKNSKVYGGLRGGISTGETIQIEVLFKPPSSIGGLAQKGRHDPCVIPRAISVLESMIYLVVADHVLAQRLDCL